MKTYADHHRIINVTTTAAAVPLRTLIKTRLDSKNPVQTLPSGKGVLQVILTPSVDMVITDAITGDEKTILAGVEKVIPSRACLDNITVKNIGTLCVELYLGGE